MKIWIDADACPKPVKDIVHRAAARLHLELVFVSNQHLRTRPTGRVKVVKVSGGFDMADEYIIRHAAPGDVAVTADIPLAARLVENGVCVLGFRGEIHTRDNIRERLVMRDFMDEMRGSGIVQGGPAPFGQKDRHAFANALDRLLTRMAR